MAEQVERRTRKAFLYSELAMHQDEMGAPHFHLRRAWPCNDEETGLTTSNQTQVMAMSERR